MEKCNGIQQEDINFDLASYSGVCEDIRHIMSEVVDMKTNNKNEEKKSDINELRMQGSFQFLSLKQLNRTAQIRCKHVKDRTLEAKQKLDGYNLQLENLQYEISHLHKEITKCLEFRSRHDDITLVSLKEFYKKAPQEISNAAVTKSDKHKQTLSRLDWELEERKQLAEKLDQLKKVKQGRADDIGVKKQRLQALAPSLQGLLKSSIPLQEALNLPLDKVKKQHDMAKLLPRPLFVLFLQAKAYQEACDALMDVSIEGDVSLARKIQQIKLLSDKNTTIISDVSNVDGEDSDSDQDEKDEQDSARGHRSRKNEESHMDTSDMTDGIKSCHPLSVVVKLNISKKGPTLQLKFSHLSTLQFVVVLCNLNATTNAHQQLLSSSLLDNDSVLKCILQDDYGLQSPNPTATFMLHKSSVDFKDILTSSGRPYLWAQKLCGLEFLDDGCKNKGGDMQVSFTHIQGIISELRKRVSSRIKLAEQVDKFKKNIVFCDKEILAHFPSKIHSNLSSWNDLSYNQYKALPYASKIVELGLLGTDEEAGNHHYFLATIRRGTTVTMNAATVVYSDYPRTVPIITILLEWRGNKTSENDQNIREMEVEVNVNWPTTVGKNKDAILSSQLMRLMAMLDIYVETECDNDQFNQPAEFSLNKICPRKVKGPGRLKPYLYQSSNKTHIHR